MVRFHHGYPHLVEPLYILICQYILLPSDCVISVKRGHLTASSIHRILHLWSGCIAHSPDAAIARKASTAEFQDDRIDALAGRSHCARSVQLSAISLPATPDHDYITLWIQATKRCQRFLPFSTFIPMSPSLSRSCDAWLLRALRFRSRPDSFSKRLWSCCF